MSSLAGREVAERPLNTNIFVRKDGALLPMDMEPGEADAKYRYLEGNLPEYVVYPKPEWFDEEQSNVRTFVAEQLGFDVSLVPQIDHVQRIHIGINDDICGRYDSLSHKAAVVALTDTKERHTAISRLLIKNMAHEAGHGVYDPQTTWAAVIHEPVPEEIRGTVWDGTDDGLITRSIATGYGSLKAHLTKPHYGDNFRGEAEFDVVGNLFEEGLAEEIAIRYVEEHWGPTVSPFAASKGGDMFARTLDYSTDREHIVTMVPAWAALSLNYLEEIRRSTDPIGNSIFDLLIQSRHLETRAPAMKELAQVINRIQPGLYSYLNHAEYSKEGFTDALLRVEDLYIKTFWGVPGFVPPPPARMAIANNQE